MSLYIDLSEFLAVPMRTGIQRIGGEICRYMPADSATPVRLQSGQLVSLPSELIGVIGSYFRDSSEIALSEIFRIAGCTGPAILPSIADRLLVPEIFGEERAAFYLNMSALELSRCRFVVYDLLPYTHPQYFPPSVPLGLAAYYRVIRSAAHCGFISDYTREMYYSRLKRTPPNGGRVLPLGSDSLGARVTDPALDRPLNFSVLGTIEPRKNHELILDAFAPLLRQVDGLTLTFIGKLGWVKRELQRRITALAADKNSGVRVLSVLPDGEIKREIQRARATIYVSDAEGYGLPPVESLWLGTPVISLRSMPSLQNLNSAGIEFVEPLTAANLRKAVVKFLDDGYTAQKIEEATLLTLPTWKSFAEEVIAWCT